MAKVLNDETFKGEVIDSGKSCLVDFFADWCGPCKMMGPIVDELAREYEGRFGVYKVDIDNAGKIAADFGVMSIPTLLFFKNGEVVDNIVGAVSKETLEEKIKLYLDTK